MVTDNLHPEFHEYVDESNKKASNSRKAVDEDLRMRIAATKTVVQLLIETNGVHYTPLHDHYNTFAVLAKISKLEKMPVITARSFQSYYWTGDKHTHYKYTTLIIPRTKRLKCVAAMLSLVSKQADNINNRRWDAAPSEAVTHNHSARRYVFDLHGDDGWEMFQLWLKQCKTNPIFKVALRSRDK